VHAEGASLVERTTMTGNRPVRDTHYILDRVVRPFKAARG
jgi:hypothetical protein